MDLSKKGAIPNGTIVIVDTWSWRISKGVKYLAVIVNQSEDSAAYYIVADIDNGQVQSVHRNKVKVATPKEIAQWRQSNER